MTIDDIKFTDAVISIPENAVKIELTITVFDDNGVNTVQGTYGLPEIRDAINLFRETVNGDYPVYELTEYGREELEKNRRRST